jgi:hypothetical protein
MAFVDQIIHKMAAHEPGRTSHHDIHLYFFLITSKVHQSSTWQNNPLFFGVSSGFLGYPLIPLGYPVMTIIPIFSAMVLIGDHNILWCTKSCLVSTAGKESLRLFN